MKLSEMTTERRISHWLGLHTCNCWDSGWPEEDAGRKVKSEFKLLDKIMGELNKAVNDAFERGLLVGVQQGRRQAEEGVLK